MFDGTITATRLRQHGHAGKTLAERLTGRFYTPDVLASDLSARVAEHLSKTKAPGALSLADPFCGDGRLVGALLEALSRTESIRGRTFRVGLADLDHAAVDGAVKALRELVRTLGLDAHVVGKVGDTFALPPKATHHAIITNPPWELLKPDAREMKRMSVGEREEYYAWLRAQCRRLDEMFPNARADVSWAGWGTNLARCGWDYSLRSCKRNGVLGIVLPSTILADQASVTMRRSALTNSTLVDLTAFPPEARLFARVDQPVVTATFVAKPTDRLDASLTLFDATRTPRAQVLLKQSDAELRASGYALPVGFGAESTSLLKSFGGLPLFKNLESDAPSGLWAGRELDETNLHEKLRERGRYPFIKGRMIQRHVLVQRPQQFVSAGFARKLQSKAFERLVWRDVSRPSQKRRMIGHIIPAGWVAGNSLHVAYFRDGSSTRLRALHTALSSYCFEFQVRTRLSTGHMSLGAVRAAHIPELTAANVRRLASAYSYYERAPTPESARHMEVAAARAFDVSRDQFAAILDHFPKVAPEEREALLSDRRWQGARRSKRI